MNPEYFSGVGTFNNFEHEIKINENVKPVVHARCKITLCLQKSDVGKR